MPRVIENWCPLKGLPCCKSECAWWISRFFPEDGGECVVVLVYRELVGNSFQIVSETHREEDNG